MQLPEIVLALRAVEEGELQRDDLARLFTIMESWDRADLKASCGELLVREFRIAPAKVRRWEAEIGGQPNRRVGKYELRRRVGQGGMGIVFEAVHPNLDRPVAVKILPPSHGKNPEAVQRFLTETKSAGRFNDPHIVHAYDAGIDGDIPFLVMEYIDGENLYQVLQRTGRFDIDVARGLLLQAAQALLVLERAGWVHGDGKPSNWMIDATGTLKLADLGLCRPPGRPGGTVFGSPPYIAPELLRQGTSPDHRVDLYSLGATFYHLLTGRPPYQATTVAELARRQKKDTIPPIRELRSEIPDDLADLIEDLLVADPDQRVTSSGEILTRLSGRRAASEVANEAPAGKRLGIAALLVVTLVGVGYVVARAVFPSTEREGDSSVVVVAPPTAVTPAQADGIAQEWRRLWRHEPRPYVQLAGWLAADGSDHPESSQWLDAMQQALDAEADPVWNAVASAVAELTAARRYGAGLDELEQFPQRLRAGRYAVIWEQARIGLMQERERTAARAVLEIQTALAAADTPRARRAFVQLTEEPLEERAWLRDRVAAQLGGLPWLDAVVDAKPALEQRQQKRRAAVVAELQRGVIPAPLAAAWIDWPMEEALGILRRQPQVLSDRDGDVWQRLYRHGCLALGGADAAQAPLLLQLVDLLEPEAAARRDVIAECKAAWWQQQVRQACVRWDLTAADAAWKQLSSLPNCLATVDEEQTSTDRRIELRRGAFLRSDAFGADVAVHWGKSPAFQYRAGPSLFNHWRARENQWDSVADGLRSRGGDGGTEALELFVPFAGGLRVELELTLPPEWALVITFGQSSLAVLRSKQGEVAVSMTAVTDVVANERGTARRWRAAEQTFAAGQVALVCALGDESWQLQVGAKTISLGAPTPEDEPRWVSVLLSRDVVLRGVTVVGDPNPRWLDARERVVRAQQEAGAGSQD
ncbi:MAG: serine/threonine-protein kinase [Planctomycetota bacterium]